MSTFASAPVTRQLRSLAPLLAAVFAAAFLVLAVVVLAAEVLDKPFGFFSREPSEVLRAPFYTGFLFHVGALAWWGGAVIALFVGFLIWQRDGRSVALPLLAGGALTAILALDDVFRIHEDFMPGKLGVPKILSYGVYAALAVAWIWVYRRFVARTEWVLLVLALVFFAVSLVLDRAFVENQKHVIEDGAKFLGIVAWTLYFVRTSYRELAAARAR